MCREIRKYEAANNIDPITITIIVGSNLEPDIEEYLDPKGDIRVDNLFRKPLYLAGFQKVNTAKRLTCANSIELLSIQRRSYWSMMIHLI